MRTFKEYLIPSLIASIFMSCYAIVDGIFIGFRMNDLGLAAINLAWPITAFIQGIGFAIGISSGIYISRLRGLGMEDKIKRIKMAILVYLLISGIFLGVLFFLLKGPILTLFQAKGETFIAADKYITIILYGSIFQLMGCALGPLLKNAGHVKIAMASSLIATLTNLILDFLLIFVFEFGLEGAAVASVIAQGAALLVCIIPYIKESSGISFDKEAFKEITLGMLAPFILNYSYSIIIILTNALCEAYNGNAATAAYTVLSYMLYVINATAQGTSDAVQPLFSYHSSRKEYKIIYKYLYKCMIISLCIVSIFSLIFFLLRDPISRLYGLSKEGKEIFNNALIYYLFGFLIISFSKVICSYLYSINQKILANILVLVEPLLLTPILYFSLVHAFRILGLWISFLVIQGILALLALLFYYLSRRKDHEWTINCSQAEGDNEPERLS